MTLFSSATGQSKRQQETHTIQTWLRPKYIQGYIVA